ncbi:MAG TPA: fibronectin type III domain-containing protein [Patescibacteria group bacterium]|nr:fibronectin type III domain-containing protein [Patescibacteria group bacterium]
MSYYDFHFNHAGVSFTTSSGDNGAGVEWPAASPYVIAVGGTSLLLDSNGNRRSETAWSGSGGGNSLYYGQPSYQIGWQNANGRGVPDVSLVADPNTGVKVYDSVNGGWFVVGGTSASAPQWAGLLALANQMRVANGSANLSSPNRSLYLIAQGSTTSPYAVNGTYFYDVSQGNNGAYNAGPPYDLVTGLGSAVANTIISALAPATVPAAPTGLTAIGKAGEIDLQWNASTGSKTYSVGRTTTSGGPYTVIASGLTSTSYQDKSTSLVPGTRYYYVVVGVNPAGTSPNSAPASAVVLAPTSSLPAAPSNLRATAVSSSQINLYWNNNTSNATGIAIEVAPPGSGFFQIGTLSASSTSCAVSGAASKTTYSFRIRAYNTSGYSAYSNTATVTTY